MIPTTPSASRSFLGVDGDHDDDESGGLGRFVCLFAMGVCNKVSLLKEMRIKIGFTNPFVERMVPLLSPWLFRYPTH